MLTYYTFIPLGRPRSVQRLRQVRGLDVFFSRQVRDSVCQFQDAVFESDCSFRVMTTHGKLGVASEI